MASMKRPRLKSVTATEAWRLELEFIDGTRHGVSLANVIERLPGLNLLQEDAAAFKQAVLADAGWTVEWLQFDIQIGADTLWLDALEQYSRDEAQREFLRWRVRHALWLAATGNARGITPRTVSAYATGASSLSDFGTVGCKAAAAVHFSPAFCPIVGLCSCKSGKNWPRRGRFSLSTTKVRQAARPIPKIVRLASEGWECERDAKGSCPIRHPRPHRTSNRDQ